MDGERETDGDVKIPTGLAPPAEMMIPHSRTGGYPLGNPFQVTLATLGLAYSTSHMTNFGILKR